MAKATKAQKVKEVKIVKAEKAGEWVLPIKVDGSVIYALQVNKTKEDKENSEAIKKAYAEHDITLYTYKGKNDADVILVKAEEKLIARRTSASTEKLIASAVAMFGCTPEQARQMVSNAKS